MSRRGVLGLVACGLLAACGPKASIEAEPDPRQVAAVKQALEGEPCREAFRFDAKQTLSVDQYFMLAVATPQDSAGGEGRLVFRPFDYDQAPVDGDWIALGVVYAKAKAASPDAVGGVVWIKSAVSRRQDGGGTIARDGQGLKLTISVEGGSASGDPTACRGDYIITLDDRGVLTADGVEVGRTG